MGIRIPVQILKVSPAEFRDKNTGAMKPYWWVSMCDDEGEVYRMRLWEQRQVPAKGRAVLNLEASADFSSVRATSFEAAPAK